MLTTPTIYLPGHDQGEPVNATPGSAGYDLPAILTRAVLTNDDKRWFAWKKGRKSGFRMTDPTTRVDFDNVIDYLRAVEPAEIAKIKAATDGFPVRHLTLKIMPGETVRVSLGIRTAIDENHLCYLFARASSAKKEYRLGNCVGVIDSDFRDEWFAAIRNCGTDPMFIDHGQSIVQAVFAHRIASAWPGTKSLSESERLGGFGSTDKPTPLLGDTTEIVADPNPQVQQQIADLTAEPSLLEEAASKPKTENDFLPIQLSCNGVNIGPVAKFRPDVHGTIYAEQGPEAVASILFREIKALAPKCLPQFVDGLFQKEAAAAPDVPVPGSDQ